MECAKNKRDPFNNWVRDKPKIKNNNNFSKRVMYEQKKKNKNNVVYVHLFTHF